MQQKKGGKKERIVALAHSGTVLLFSSLLDQFKHWN